MAKISARNCYFTFAGRSYQADLNNVDLNITVEAQDVSVFGTPFKQYVDGLQDGQVAFAGWWDAATAATNMDASLYTQLRNGTLLWELMPQGSASGRILYQSNGVLTGYKVTSPLSGAVAAAMSIQSSGSVTRSIAA